MDTDNKMTHRSALKRMGLAVAGVTAASSGLFSLTSCEEKKKKCTILYFTGTGNCLYVARQLGGTEKAPDARYRNEHVSLMDIKLTNSQL